MNTRAFLSVCITLSILILVALSAPASRAAEEGKAQTLCPIMGGKIDKTAYLDYEGKRVYFCCAGCKDTFLKDPKKHISRMESEGVVLESVPAGEKVPSHHHKEGQHKGEHHGSEHHGCGDHGCALCG